MRILGAYEKARIYIEQHTQLSDLDKLKMRKRNPGPTITISRETGIGAERICEELIKYFEFTSKEDTYDWAYFDKDLIAKVIEQHDLPNRLSKFMTNEQNSTMNLMLNELLGLQPSRLKLIHKTAETIYQLAELGNAIIVGRASNLITAKLKNTFHVRLVAPLNDRIKNAQLLYHKDKKEITEFIKMEDRLRSDFVHKYYHKDIANPLLYHLVINTSLLSFEDIAETIACNVVKKFPKMFELSHNIFKVQD
ncbi:MAG: cytidylate kinase-like family protein [Bacteroidetes bacterium]|nr:cytidylate kinase-like family protein [Bacteroidota bacterium]MBU1116034.1 cytidylate kinase-like family protein [Bacteroidota bacterium]MBU1799198.1 cytidylate kinase-like family protein [Bacteroidota bacterium]